MQTRSRLLVTQPLPPLHRLLIFNVHYQLIYMSYLDQLFSLENQTAVVIGGTGTLCGEMAQGLAQAGAHTVLVGRSEEKAKERMASIEAAGGKASFIAALASTASEKGTQADSEIENTLMDIVDQRLQRLENRVALLDDVEAMLEAERVALELERRAGPALQGREPTPKTRYLVQPPRM